MAELNNDAPISPEINKYLAILSKDPGSMVFASLVEVYRKAGMLDEAIATAQDGLKLHPNYVSGMVALGRAYYEKGMLIEASETLEKVRAIAPDNIVAANILEEIRKQWQEVGEKEEAEVKVEVEESPEEVTPVFEVVEETEQEVIEADELEELEEIEAVKEAGSLFGEEITEELWTGETIPEGQKVEVKVEEEEAKPKREITTSTIADLYIKQGYIDKAVDIYQALYNANPYNEEIKGKLDELKRQVEVEEQVEVKVEEEPTVGWAEPTSEEPEIISRQEAQYADEEMKPEEQKKSVDENIKRLESWLRTIQSERRKV
ncbi:MAG: hypothetical protein Q7T53_02265 [Deltaproteobacteria bacterium]|nr:hypothetical protein [Deltaproteobacteria bacterium]